MDAHGTDALDRQPADPDAFWLEASKAINWIRRPKRVHDDTEPGAGWFPGGTLNTCYNAVDRHVINGRADDVALVHDDAAGDVRTFTFAQLLEQVAQCAGVLQALSVAPGEQVLIALPMIPEAVIVMLACARIGAVHCVVGDDLSVPDLTAWIDDIRPTVVVAATWPARGDRLVDKRHLDAALAQAAHRVESCIVVQRPGQQAELTDRDFDWAQVTKPGAVQSAGCVAVAATDPLCLVPAVGADGQLESIVQDNGGPAVALSWVMKHRHDMGSDDVWCADLAADWPRDQVTMVYAPLLVGATAVLVAGTSTGVPDAQARLVEGHGVTGLLTSPEALRGAREQDAGPTHPADVDVSSLRTLAVADGELDPQTATWVAENLGHPAVTSWWPHVSEWPAGAAPVVAVR